MIDELGAEKNKAPRPRPLLFVFLFLPRGAAFLPLGPSVPLALPLDSCRSLKSEACVGVKRQKRKPGVPRVGVPWSVARASMRDLGVSPEGHRKFQISSIASSKNFRKMRVQVNPRRKSGYVRIRPDTSGHVRITGFSPFYPEKFVYKI